MRKKPLILSAIGAYWPGNDASGPNQSFRALAQGLQDDFDFHLLARDRPFDAAQPYAPAVSPAEFPVTYLQPGRIAPRGLLDAIRQIAPDILWVNGFFDREFTIPLLLARRLDRLPDMPILLSPRGEFNRGALMLKTTRKRSYLALAQATGLFRGISLHATSETEAQTIRAMLPKHDRIVVAPNIRPLLPALPHVPDPTLRVVFLGRISPIKNLAYAIRVLQDVRAPVQFDIHGPIEDTDYLRMCLDMATDLPSHVGVTHHGPYPNSSLPDLLSRADLLLLPSAGENFGHAIFEALSCGVPVVISDRTPWRDLTAHHAGWDLPLDVPEAFAAAIDSYAEMDPKCRAIWRDGAATQAKQHIISSDAVSENRLMLTSFLA